MATTVVLADVIKEPGPSTRCLARFSDGTELEFSSLASLTTIVQEPDTDAGLTRKLCLAYALARSSDLSNINPVKDKSFIFDLSNNNPIRVQ